MPPNPNADFNQAVMTAINQMNDRVNLLGRDVGDIKTLTEYIKLHIADKGAHCKHDLGNDIPCTALEAVKDHVKSEQAIKDGIVTTSRWKIGILISILALAGGACGKYVVSVCSALIKWLGTI